MVNVTSAKILHSKVVNCEGKVICLVGRDFDTMHIACFSSNFQLFYGFMFRAYTSLPPTWNQPFFKVLCMYYLSQFSQHENHELITGSISIFHMKRLSLRDVK